MKCHKAKILKVMTIVILSFSPYCLKSQITIGSSEKPVSGALLDLKEGSDGMSTRGLGLPRVALNDLNSLIDVGIIDPTQEETHTGLLVYNSAEVNSFGTSICKGLYVWDGQKWQALEKRKIKEDMTMTDGDGNVYPAKWFGPSCDLSKGAYWITENLYSSTQADGSPLPDNVAPGGQILPGARINPGIFYKRYASEAEIADFVITTPVSTLTGVVSYGESDNPIGTVTAIPRSDFVRKFGLLYSRNQSTTLCPATSGWRLPSIDDWKKLDTYFGDAFVMGPYMRANNKYYLANDLSGDVNNSKKWGVNDNLPAGAVLSDFNALPAGTFNSSHTAEGFGSESVWRTNRLLTQDDGRLQKFDDTTVYYSASGGVINHYYSVRCVKDGN